MSEFNFIEKEDKVYIYNGQGFVELWDFSKSNINDLSRIEAISTVASVCYGNNAATNPEILYDKLKSENMGISTSTFEFIRNYKDSRIKNSFRNNKELEYTSRKNINKQRNEIITFRIKIPLFVSKQIMRHRQAAWQELSRRFVGNEKVDFEFYTSNELNYQVEQVVKTHYEQSKKVYNILRRQGYRKEIARAVMPVSYMTIIWIQINKKWFNYLLSVRLEKHVQRETRELVNTMKFLANKHRKHILSK